MSQSPPVCSLTGDGERDLLLRGAQLVLREADVDAGVVAEQGDDLQRAVRQQAVAARVPIDLSETDSLTIRRDQSDQEEISSSIIE